MLLIFFNVAQKVYLCAMDYWKFSFVTDEETSEMLLAYFSDTAFDTFEEVEGGLNAYLPASASVEEAEAQIQALDAQFEFTWTKSLIQGQNWNALWESNFQPITVGNFCSVRADFHPANATVRYDLIINPRMAFGTGHHETTYQCLAAIERLPVANAHLLDYGCGTGILAILAAKNGAQTVEAVDIELESYENTIDNCRINAVENVIARCGTLEAVEGSNFDGILANINRNVILDSFPRLYELLKPGAWLLCSGILAQDETIICESAAALGLQKKFQGQRGNWLCIEFQK